MTMILEGRGTDFDPEVVDTFLAIKEELVAIKEKNQDQDESMLIQLSRKSLHSIASFTLCTFLSILFHPHAYRPFNTVN